MSKSMFDLPDGIEGLIPVMCCWNDDNGNFNEKMVKLDLHDAIEIETQFVSEDFDLEGIACKLDGNVLTICGEQFPFQHHRTWVGNIMWDLIWMTPEDVLRLLNCLQASRHFNVDSGLTVLLDRFETREPFNQEDLALIVEGAGGFAL